MLNPQPAPPLFVLCMRPVNSQAGSGTPVGTLAEIVEALLAAPMRAAGGLAPGHACCPHPLCQRVVSLDACLGVGVPQSCTVPGTSLCAQGPALDACGTPRLRRRGCTTSPTPAPLVQGAMRIHCCAIDGCEVSRQLPARRAAAGACSTPLCFISKGCGPLPLDAAPATLRRPPPALQKAPSSGKAKFCHEHANHGCGAVVPGPQEQGQEGEEEPAGPSTPQPCSGHPMHRGGRACDVHIELEARHGAASGPEQGTNRRRGPHRQGPDQAMRHRQSAVNRAGARRGCHSGQPAGQAEQRAAPEQQGWRDIPHAFSRNYRGLFAAVTPCNQIFALQPMPCR